MKEKRNYRLGVLLLFFIISISTTSVCSEVITTYGLLGEARTTPVASESQINVAELTSLSKQSPHVKGMAIDNPWLELIITLICLTYLVYRGRIREEETIVSLCVRMDD